MIQRNRSIGEIKKLRLDLLEIADSVDSLIPNERKRLATFYAGVLHSDHSFADVVERFLAEQNQEYRNHIVSTPEMQVFLHRTFRDVVDEILQNGFCVSGSDIRGSVSVQPESVLVAEGLYRNGRAYGDSVVIVKIPKRIWEPAYIIAKGNEITLPQIGYWNEGRKQYAIKPEFVRGWIDRETDELHLR